MDMRRKHYSGAIGIDLDRCGAIGSGPTTYRHSHHLGPNLIVNSGNSPRKLMGTTYGTPTEGNEEHRVCGCISVTDGGF